MKKLSSFFRDVLGFILLYVLDLAYIPVYLAGACTACYCYVLFCDVMQKPYGINLWKLLIIVLLVLYFSICTVLNILTFCKVKKRLKEARKITESAKASD